MVFGGLDTTTSALARCIYLLAKHPSAQARLRSEIRDAMKSLAQEDDKIPSAELPYDVLTNLPFLDGVVKETLRMFPSFPFTARQYVLSLFILHKENLRRSTEQPKPLLFPYNSRHAHTPVHPHLL